MTLAEFDQLWARWALGAGVRREPFWAVVGDLPVGQIQLAAARVREQRRKLTVVALRGALDEVTEVARGREEVEAPAPPLAAAAWVRVHGHQGICPPGCPQARPGAEAERSRQGYRRQLLALGRRLRVADEVLEVGLNVPEGGLQDLEVRRQYFNVLEGGSSGEG